MEQLTPTQRPSSCLVLLLTVSFLAAVCSPNVKALPEPRVHASIAPGSIQQGTEVVAALVTAQKANLRRSPSISATVAMVLNKGTLLTVLEPSPVGPWYQVRDSKTDTEGWIHGNAIALLQTIGTAATPRDGRTEQGVSTAASATPTPAQRPRATSPISSGRSYVNVDGIRVRSPVFTGGKPDGATARCRDGSYSFSQHRSGTCSHHGGVAEWF